MRHLLVWFFIFYAVTIFADRKSLKEAEVEIENATRALAEVEGNTKFKEFLPALFADAKIHLYEAWVYLIEKEPDWAVYHAQLSIIMSNAALYKAKADFLARELLLEQIKYWKKVATSGEKGNFYQDKVKELEKELFIAKLKLFTAETKMEKKGRVYVLTLYDKDLFIPGTFSISQTGKPMLDKVLSFVSTIPKTKITIEGHTSYPDKENNSIIKATSVKDYLVRNSSVVLERVEIAGYGNQNPLIINNTVVKGKDNDRIAIVFDFPAEYQEEK